MSNILEVNNLNVSYGGIKAVKEISFHVPKGQVVTLIGANGAGKSSTLRSIVGLVRPEGGSIQFKETELAGLPTDQIVPKGITLVPEGRRVFSDLTVLENLKIGAYMRKDSLEEDLNWVHDLFPRLKERSWQLAGTLSGGEQQMLAIARAMLSKTELMLLDEPSNDLDVATLGWLEGFLLGCKVPVLYISHDEPLLEHTANVIIHLERLRRRTAPRCTVARTGYVQYVEQRAAGFARQEQNARKERAEFDAKLDKFRQIRNKVEHQQAVITRQDPHGGRLLKKKMHAVQSMGRRFERERENMTALPEWEEAILTAFNGAKSALPTGKTVLRLDLPELAAGGRTLSRSVRLWVDGPEHLGIVGANGAGKSTLLKLAAETLLSREDIRAAYMPQNYNELLLEDKTPVELLAPSGHKDDITRARTLLGSMKYKAEEMEHPAAALSGGQRAKLLFLSMVLNGANVLVLDEPTRNFSPLSAPVIRQVLAQFPGAIISVSHDRLYLEQVCTRVLELGPEGLAPWNG